MSLTQERAIELGEEGTNALFLGLTTLGLVEDAPEPFIRHANQLELSPRVALDEEERRLFFEFACLGLAVIGMLSKSHLQTESRFNPRLDPEKHQHFLDGLFQAATYHLDRHGISELRERLPRGNRNAATLEYRNGKPLSGPHLKERVDGYMNRFQAKADRGACDHTDATRDDFTFHLTELIDARLSDRNDEIQPEIDALSHRMVHASINIVQLIFGEK